MAINFLLIGSGLGSDSPENQQTMVLPLNQSKPHHVHGCSV